MNYTEKFKQNIMKPKHMRSGVCVNEYQSLPSRRNPETFPAGAMAKREKGKAFLSLSLSLSPTKSTSSFSVGDPNISSL